MARSIPGAAPTALNKANKIAKLRYFGLSLLIMLGLGVAPAAFHLTLSSAPIMEVGIAILIISVLSGALSTLFNRKNINGNGKSKLSLKIETFRTALQTIATILAVTGIFFLPTAAVGLLIGASIVNLIANFMPLIGKIFREKEGNKAIYTKIGIGLLNTLLPIALLVAHLVVINDPILLAIIAITGVFLLASTQICLNYLSTINDRHTYSPDTEPATQVGDIGDHYKSKQLETQEQKDAAHLTTEIFKNINSQPKENNLIKPQIEERIHAYLASKEESIPGDIKLINDLCDILKLKETPEDTKSITDVIIERGKKRGDILKDSEQDGIKSAEDEGEDEGEGKTKRKGEGEAEGEAKRKGEGEGEAEGEGEGESEGIIPRH